MGLLPGRPGIDQQIATFAPLIVANLSKDGFELPDMIRNFYPGGDMIVAGIIKHGKDNILNAMKQVPQLWDTIMRTYGEEHTAKWIEDFVNYKDVIAKIEEEEEEEEEVTEDSDLLVPPPPVLVDSKKGGKK